MRPAADCQADVRCAPGCDSSDDGYDRTAIGQALRRPPNGGMVDRHERDTVMRAACSRMLFASPFGLSRRREAAAFDVECRQVIAAKSILSASMSRYLLVPEAAETELLAGERELGQFAVGRCEPCGRSKHAIDVVRHGRAAVRTRRGCLL